MDNNGSLQAFPSSQHSDGFTVNSVGLTKREYFAAMAMQGLLSFMPSQEHTVKDAVDYADALLKHLESNPLKN